MAPEGTQRPHAHRAGRRAVRVVVGDDEQPLAALDRFGEQARGVRPRGSQASGAASECERRSPARRREKGRARQEARQARIAPGGHEAGARRGSRRAGRSQAWEASGRARPQPAPARGGGERCDARALPGPEARCARYRGARCAAEVVEPAPVERCGALEPCGEVAAAQQRREGVERHGDRSSCARSPRRSVDACGKRVHRRAARERARPQRE